MGLAHDANINIEASHGKTYCDAGGAATRWLAALYSPPVHHSIMIPQLICNQQLA